jgi:cytochrome c553
MNKAVIATVMAVGLVGCVGGIDPTNGDDTQSGTAKEMFDNNVHPLLARCASCHTNGSESGNVTGFYKADLSTAYTTATGYVAFVGDYTPQSAPVLTKILPGNHNGQMWSTDEVNTITAWLNKELEERGNVGTGNPPTTGESEAQVMLRLKNNWSSCMTLTDFQSADMTNQFGRMQAQNPNEQCQQCHDTGYEGMIITSVESRYYSYLSQHSRYMLQYFAFDLTQGIQNAKIIVNQTSFMAVSQAKPPHTQHPTFDATTNQGMTALGNWYDLINMKVMAAGPNGCGPTQLID